MVQTIDQIRARFNNADRMDCRDIADLFEHIDALQKRDEPSLQDRVALWVKSAFGDVAAYDKVERIHRFTEEALELAQAAGATREDCLQLVDYVYSRPIGTLAQEVGGTLSTLYALCAAYHVAAEAALVAELERCWLNIEKIRAKQAAKPKFGPLPGKV
jgi:hypothetical protein